MITYYVMENNEIKAFDTNKQNIQNSYYGENVEILETERPIIDFQFADTEEYNAQQAIKERERLDSLSMTRGDVFEALILAKGLEKAQIRLMIENADLDNITKLIYLNRFDEALEFYRGYPIFNLLGEQVGITPEMWDEFFETKDYSKLLN